MKKLPVVLLKRLFVVTFVIFVLMISFSGDASVTSLVSNISNVTSLQAINIVSKYDNTSVSLEVRKVENMDEVARYGADGPVSFIGQMTGYSAYCLGCGGRVSCPPRQDVRNGNIYYTDSEYGVLRILAADPHIPCGTIVKINNLTFSSEPIYGIVLDRGGAIKGNIMDFLVESDESFAADYVGRQRNVEFTLVRWGW